MFTFLGRILSMLDLRLFCRTDITVSRTSHLVVCRSIENQKFQLQLQKLEIEEDNVSMRWVNTDFKSFELDQKRQKTRNKWCIMASKANHAER